MILKADSETYFVFDLDDTLYCEIDFLQSAYKSIASKIEPENHFQLSQDMFDVFKSGRNTFEYLIERYPQKNLTKENLLYLYRNHYPAISLREGVLKMFTEIKIRNGMTGIITDGRSITQRNKIKALGLEKLLDKVIISEEFGCEKPDHRVFKSFMEKDKVKQYFYIGDNISKDFISPKKLSWCCIGILGERNVHLNDLSIYSIEYLPHFFIENFSEIDII